MNAFSSSELGKLYISVAKKADIPLSDAELRNTALVGIKYAKIATQY